MIDRSPWLQPFSLYEMPPWPCPHCANGTLHLKPLPKQAGVRHDKFRLVEEDDRASLRNQQQPDSHPSESTGRFGAILHCTDPKCQEIVAVCGRFDSGTMSNEYEEFAYSIYRPHYFSPAPPIFRCPATCPAKLRQELTAAFSLYWCDINSCLNRIRSAVELLLDHLKISRYAKPRKGTRRQRLNLAWRIDTLSKKQPALASSLTALRWLGNVGTHAGVVTREDALDGFELMDHVVDELFVRRHRTIGIMARAIIKRKGPRARK